MNLPLLKEVAARIADHLRRMEADPKINIVSFQGKLGERFQMRRLYCASCWASGPRVFAIYHSNHQQVGSSLTGAQARQYLAWLDAGNNGTHYEMMKR